MKKISKNGFLKIGALVLVFLLGLGIGSDKINLGADKIYRQSIQESSGSIDYHGIDELYGALRDGYDGQIDSGEIEDGLKAGLVRAAGDPYTEYLNQEQTKEFNEDLDGEFDGIGAELGKKDQYVIIISPMDGSPAQKAGIKAQDIISKINDETAYDISISEAVKKIRGQKDTKVKLEIIRDGKAQTIEIVRARINIPSVKSEITAENIAVLKISRFGPDTVDLVSRYAREYKDKKVKGVVIDMRGNPGGLLDGAVKISSIWLPKGKTVLEEKRDNKVIRTHYSNGNSILLGTPTVVLIDEGSASASEIVAGALKDNGVAALIGQKSFGKGSVQEIRNLNDGGTLKVTIARWFTPSGRNIDKEGIEPDQKIELTENDIKLVRDPQKQAAINKLK